MIELIFIDIGDFKNEYQKYQLIPTPYPTKIKYIKKIHVMNKVAIRNILIATLFI